jgi:hypothetical protein
MQQPETEKIAIIKTANSDSAFLFCVPKKFLKKKLFRIFLLQETQDFSPYDAPYLRLRSIF